MTVKLDVGQGIVLAHGDGEEVATRESRSVLVKADLEQISVTESWYGSRQEGAGPHTHRRHADSFYVIEGELKFFTGGGPLTASEGAAFLAPPLVVHGFANERDGAARFLNFHTPNCGFAESLRARRDPGYDPERYDTFDPPADAPPGAVVMPAGHGDRLDGETRTATIKIARDELALVEFDLRPGFRGPKAHVHERHVDLFYVVAGEPRFRLGDTAVDGEPGMFVAAPPGVVHSFANPGPARALVVNVHAPSCAFHEYLHVMENAEGELDEATHKAYDVYEVE